MTAAAASTYTEASIRIDLSLFTGAVEQKCRRDKAVSTPGSAF